MNNHLSKSGNTRRGQTLIEALLALSVVTISFMGITTLFARSFFYDRVTSDELTATYLASEGIELAKNFLDYGTYSATPYGGADWGGCFEPSGGEYQIDYTMTTCAEITQNVVGSSWTPLDFSTSTGYQYETGSPSNFSRVIEVSFPTRDSSGRTLNGNEAVVQSTVNWNTGPITQSVTVEDHFYDWRQ